MNWHRRLFSPGADPCHVTVGEHSPVPSHRSSACVLKNCVRGLWLVGLVLFICMAEAQQSSPTQPARTRLPQQNINTKPNVAYVGDEACKQCHGLIYAKFKQTGMGKSASIPSTEDPRELTKPVEITKKNQTYSIYARDGKVIQKVSERDAEGRIVYSEAHDIAYSVGAGDLGISYLVTKGDSLFVAPISYYTHIRGWDLTPGYADGTFHGFTRRVVDLCVDCHTGWPELVPGSQTRFQRPPFRFLKIGCERCHGPGEIHVAERTQDAMSGTYQQESTDWSIVNPRKLPTDVRDDVCAQCHFSGDARVLQPGKNFLDFRPGTPLGDIVAIFSVSPAIKGSHFMALGQFEQMKMSRCWAGSNGRLGCISCHDPHVQLHGDEAVAFYRERCMTCHTTNHCTESNARRQATSPPDNCISCHMPKQSTENVGHASLTDHRVLRNSSEVPAALRASSLKDQDLIYGTRPPPSNQALANLRNMALAYSQLTGPFPEFSVKGFELLQQAAAELPADAEVQTAYALAVSETRPEEHDRAVQALQRAIDAGSKYAAVRSHLARLRMEEDNVPAAIELLNEAIKIDPFDTAQYHNLAYAYSVLNDDAKATEVLKSALQIDPGDDVSRQMLLKFSASPEKK
ncbi:MAG: tetratricopeptide repeat protein [Terriglobales bacterium]|nr:tetratricopeptide repeat protein [Terriglobales bacterium]